MKTPLMRVKTVFIILFFSVIVLCAGHATLAAPQDTPLKVIHISSYDNNYSWNDALTKELHDIFNKHHIDIQTFYLDSHHLTVDQLTQRGKQFRDTILKEKPNAIIATDDASIQYVIKPYFLDSSIPVVFSGINWNISEYGLPSANSTGMIEINPTLELFHAMNRIVGKNMDTVHIAFIAPDTFSQHKNAYYETRMTGKHYHETYMVHSVDEWKQAYIKAQKDNDYIYLANITGLDNVSKPDIQAFINANTIIPTCSNLPSMSPYTVLTFAKFPEEQADWAASTVLDILLNGKSPADIPVTTNKKAQILLNTALAEKLKLTIPRDILELSVSVP